MGGGPSQLGRRRHMKETILASLLGVGGGGVLGHGLAIWSARKKVPAEVDSIIVTGAETTVQAALSVAAAEAARADRAEAKVAEQDAHIERLLAQVEQLQTALNAVRDELHALRVTD